MGRVLSFGESYGFLQVLGEENSKDVFFHKSCLRQGLCQEGQLYWFTTEEDECDKVQAMNMLLHRPELKRTQVDSAGEVTLQKVTVGQYTYDYESFDGTSVMSLGTTCLAKARAAIGKEISHPVPENVGKPTNDPTLSQSMKSGSSGKKAA